MRKEIEHKLRATFRRHRVMTIEEVQRAMGDVSKITAFRHLKKLDYLTSYTHSCRYYTLKEIAEFDEDGLWCYGEIGFSKHGTLKDH